MTEHIPASGDQCQLCGEDRPSTLTEHYIIDPEYGGPHTEDNRILCCENCKAVLSTLYSEEFYERLGVEPREGDPREKRIQQYLIADYDSPIKWPDTNDFEGLELEGKIEVLRQRANLKQLNDRLVEVYEEVRPRSEFEKPRFRTVIDVVAYVEEGYDEGAPQDEVKELALEEGFSKVEFYGGLEVARRKGEIYSPREDHYRTT